jgi:hypothetical protein
MLAHGQLGIDALLENGQPGLLQARLLHRGEVVGDAAERLTVPLGQCAAQQLARLGVLARVERGAALLGEVLELREVDAHAVLGQQLQPVPGRLPPDARLGAE